jgi:hypothetical protein
MIQLDADGKMPAEAKTIAEWSLYLHAISACNMADTTHPCPTTTPDAAPARSE